MTKPTEILTMVPAKVRLWMYSSYALGSLFVAYLDSKDLFIGNEEQTLWLGIGVLIGAQAASNVAPSNTSADNGRRAMRGNNRAG